MIINNQFHVQPKSTGESKTKPTQASVKELRGSGLSPDLIVCRSEMPIIDEVKQKISNFCHVKPDRVKITTFFSLSINAVGAIFIDRLFASMTEHLHIGFL